MTAAPPIRILLIGPNGQLGWELSRALPKAGEVIEMARPQIDLAEPDSIRAAVRGARPDVVVVAAGYTNVDGAEHEPDLAEAVNAIAPGVLAEEAERVGAGLVHYSTDYVFDGRKGAPYLPEDEPNPLNAYGRTKLGGEQAIRAAGAAHLIFRTSWMYSLKRSNFLLTMLKLAATKREIRVVDDQEGCPSWSRLVARGTADILIEALAGEAGARSFGGRGGVYHLACCGSTTWCGLARHIFECAGLEAPPQIVPISTAEYPTAATRPAYSVLDCRGTEETFGVALEDWRPALAQALRDDASLVESLSRRGSL